MASGLKNLLWLSPKVILGDVIKQQHCQRI